MQWEAVGAVAELLGAIGVIASLVYLALQIRQNSAMLAQSAEVARANAAVTSGNYGAEFLAEMALDADAARIWQVGTRRPQDLAPEERGRFELMMTAQVIQMDVNLALLRSGSLDPEIHGIWERILDGWIAHPDFRRLWSTGALPAVTTDSFEAWVNARIEASEQAEATAGGSRGAAAGKTP